MLAGVLFVLLVVAILAIGLLQQSVASEARTNDRLTADRIDLTAALADARRAIDVQRRVQARLTRKHETELAEKVGRIILLEEQIRDARAAVDKLIERLAPPPPPPPPPPKPAFDQPTAEEKALRVVTNDTLTKLAEHLVETEGMTAEKAMAHAKELGSLAEAMYA